MWSVLLCRMGILSLFSVSCLFANIEEIVPLLKVYEVPNTAMIRVGKQFDGGYVIPTFAVEAAEVVIGYGIGTDISFEDEIVRIFGKPAYGFDCTVLRIRPSQKNCHFISSCIGSSTRPSKGNYAPFAEHLKRVGATQSRIFLKMDIEGDEYETLPEVLRYAPQITGIVLEVHFMKEEEVEKAVSLLQELEKDFLLVHVHGNNCAYNTFKSCCALGSIPRVLELTYVNRRLVPEYRLAENQQHPTALDMANCTERPDAKFTLLP